MPPSPRLANTARGNAAEQQALDYLLNQGLLFIEKNYRCQLGELDLIMRDGQTLVIVEVRFRQSNQFGGAAASITTKKQARIIAATEHYIMTHPLDCPIRFDVVAITGDNAPDWIKNAFQT